MAEIYDFTGTAEVTDKEQIMEKRIIGENGIDSKRGYMCNVNAERNVVVLHF